MNEEQEQINHTISDDALDGLLEHFADASGDLPSVMETCYNELKLIGGAFHRANNLMQDAIKLNLRLCLRYNQNIENYLRVKELLELSASMENPTNVEIADHIVNDITFNSN